ncbi:MAG: hypothetical protein MUP14_01810, partial [Dehalococcoidia bacterium]|nr:hypothetical protein [Dehalococcoidia bacterium]
MKTARVAIALLLAICLAVPLAACGGGDEGGAPTAGPSPTAAAGEPTLAPTPSATAGAPAAGKIAFQSNRDGNDEVYVMNADGSGQINLTNNPAADAFPAWSP